ncbi:hypothetical protein ACFQJC_06305 [Haloferax namakaokahaiae]|uniref:Uncharacterized protein n=1 Tax=Haloferax namakaokahaiae TaxID=1748331 RepID=A0ABD5ZD32_9EURY
MALVDSVIVFLVSFLIGALGIYVGGRIVTQTKSFGKAALTALIGALAWSLTGLLFGWIPLLGPLLALIVYLAVVNWQYPSGWASAAAIALIAWVTSAIILYLLTLFNILAVNAFGVPGV